jgi:hypothetical protein
LPLFKFTGARFADEIRRRREAITGRTLSARIRVPEELIWWYWQEFGTATRATDSERTAPYPIPGEDSTSKGVAFEGRDGGLVIRHRVWHPGVYPRAFVRMVIDEIVAGAWQDIADDLVHGRLAEAHEALLSKSLTRAKELIVESMAQQLTGTRPDGKLGGASASEVFNTQAEIVDTT